MRNKTKEELWHAVRELLAIVAGKPCLGKKEIAQRYNVTVRTVERWRQQGRLPKPRTIRGPLWTPEQIQTHEEAH